ncbi:hypothetical protein [Sulfitobacter sabulilitoris]|uniref:Uncharacterized protein n=1 Tax=Sulfitobacter sabulilitoris TaxID=2562655 RepID=A0A5S3PLU1_9RHOB|nr:hypothetical protein [Sulfitobacter sabulilitoris]TMM55394.1 hypothetical protein FDT80_07535 [Sulfitobacter sabulilitoris]
MAKHNSRRRPHLWEKEIALLIKQSLLYISGGEVSDDVLSEAKYHRQKPSFRTPFYLRQYGGKSFLDQIVVEFSPKDDLFERRAGLNISVRDLEGDNLRSKIAENLLESGFSPVGALDNGFIAYTDGKSDLEVFIHQTEEDATVSIRKL